LTGFTRLTGLENHVNPVNPVEKETLVLQFLPDFALWPGLKLGVEVSFDVSPERDSPVAVGDQVGRMSVANEPRSGRKSPSEVAEGELNAGCGEAKYVAVPKSDANIGEHDPVRNRAVQDNFIRVEVPVPAGATSVKIIATDPGVVIDRIGVRVNPSTPNVSPAKPFAHQSRALPFADEIVYNAF